MSYHEYIPAWPLNQFVQLIWIQDMAGSGPTTSPERIVADGIVELVFHCLMDTLSSSESKLVFSSISSENAPPGLRARVIYRIKNEKEFEETFELAMPGKDYQLFLTNYWKRKRFPW